MIKSSWPANQGQLCFELSIKKLYRLGVWCPMHDKEDELYALNVQLTMYIMRGFRGEGAGGATPPPPRKPQVAIGFLIYLKPFKTQLVQVLFFFPINISLTHFVFVLTSVPNVGERFHGW